jgi:hypothetical protein
VFVEPPVRSGQAVAGLLPGLAVLGGTGPVLIVGTGVVGVAVAVRVGVAAVVGAVVGALVGAAVAAPLTLGLGRGRTTRSGPQALTATTLTATRRALRSREWVFKASIVTHPRCSVEFANKRSSSSYAERTERASTSVLR